MGNQGVSTRVLSARLRNRWTYAGDGVAPGQITAARLLRDFRFRRIAADAALYAVVGNPIIHSRSPVMHNAGFAALGLNAVYVPLEARDAADFVAFATHMGLRGVSITAPFKISLMPRADEIDALATRVGAINTVTVRGRPLARGQHRRRGVPRAARAPHRARRDAGHGARFGRRGACGGRGAREPQGASHGLGPQRARVRGRLPRWSAARWASFHRGRRAGTCWSTRRRSAARRCRGRRWATAPLDGRIVYDLVYAPADTELLQAARAAGVQTIGGLEMLIAQAERQFELWTGQRPPAGLFEAAATASDDAAVVAARG